MNIFPFCSLFFFAAAVCLVSTLLILFYLCSFCYCCWLCWWMCQAHEMIYWWISQHHCLSIFHVQMNFFFCCCFVRSVRFGFVQFRPLAPSFRDDGFLSLCLILTFNSEHVLCVYIHKYTKLDVTKQMNDFFCWRMRAREKEHAGNWMSIPFWKEVYREPSHINTHTAWDNVQMSEEEDRRASAGERVNGRNEQINKQSSEWNLYTLNEHLITFFDVHALFSVFSIRKQFCWSFCRRPRRGERKKRLASRASSLFLGMKSLAIFWCEFHAFYFFRSLFFRF